MRRDIPEVWEYQILARTIGAWTYFRQKQFREAYAIVCSLVEEAERGGNELALASSQDRRSQRRHAWSANAIRGWSGRLTALTDRNQKATYW